MGDAPLDAGVSGVNMRVTCAFAVYGNRCHILGVLVPRPLLPLGRPPPPPLYSLCHLV
jgi:hypothetical protein